MHIIVVRSALVLTYFHLVLQQFLLLFLAKMFSIHMSSVLDKAIHIWSKEKMSQVSYVKGQKSINKDGFASIVQNLVNSDLIYPFCFNELLFFMGKY